MQGFMRIIQPDGSETTEQLTAVPALPALREAVGGSIESVPFYDRLLNNRQQRCWVIVNEEGKLEGLPYNRKATEEWAEVLVRSGQIKDRADLYKHDHLVGPVAVLWGDDAFMSQL